MDHEDEYHGAMVEMLELVWGAGYMAPGGPGSVSKMLSDMETRGRTILDIGCGIGGPAQEMAMTHGAHVTGIDLESALLERARSDAEDAGLTTQCRFIRVQPGTLPFDD